MDTSLFWGKTAKDGRWHPAVCHMSDVGQVARAMVSSVLPPHLVSQLAYALGVPGDDLPAWAGLVASLHDFGKITPGFQGKSPRHFAPIQDTGLMASPVDIKDHGRLTFLCLSEALTQRGVGAGAADLLTRILGGHHGAFPAVGDGLPPEKGPWCEAREQVLAVLEGVFGIWLDGSALRGMSAAPGGWLLWAGFVSVSDWIGSDSRFFPYVGRPQC